MAYRSLRGMSLGTRSLESDVGTTFAPRSMVRFDCPDGHRTILPMSDDADLPDIWECSCGKTALRENATMPESKPTKPPRTHWDMLLERRSRDDLEELLTERLDLLRSGQLRRSA